MRAPIPVVARAGYGQLVDFGAEMLWVGGYGANSEAHTLAYCVEWNLLRASPRCATTTKETPHKACVRAMLPKRKDRPRRRRRPTASSKASSPLRDPGAQHHRHGNCPQSTLDHLHPPGPLPALGPSHSVYPVARRQTRLAIFNINRLRLPEERSSALGGDFEWQGKCSG